MTRCTPENVHFVCQDLDHPEGLNFAADGSLIAGGEAGQIYRIDCSSGKSETIAETGGTVLGVCTDGAGAVCACDAGRNEVLKTDAGGEVSVLSTGALDNPNYCAFDAAGNLFFTESVKYHPQERTGRLFVITPDGKTECVHDGPFGFANGICIDPETSLLYLVESTGPRVLVFQTDGPKLARPDRRHPARWAFRGALPRLHVRMAEPADEHRPPREQDLLWQYRRMAYRHDRARADAVGCNPTLASILVT